MKSLTPEDVRGLMDGASGGFPVHFVGIGGCGMSGMAHMCVDLGWRVSGSDLEESMVTRELSERGASVHAGHCGQRLIQARPRLVIYTPAIRRDNPELVAANQLGVPIVRRAVFLAALMQFQRGICVAGMHGKTTTSAMLAFALRRLKLDASHAIGAAVPQLDRAARMAMHVSPLAVSGVGALSGEGVMPKDAPVRRIAGDAWFVAEADESDGTLPLFHPEHSLLLNVDEEHLDFYAGMEAICSDFGRLVAQTSGTVVYCADDPHLVRLVAGRDKSVSYGFSAAADYRVECAQTAGGASGKAGEFEVFHKGSRLGRFRIHLPGAMNMSNAAGVITLLHGMGFEPGQIDAAISPFTGAARRQQILFNDGRIRVIDDYGHHPEEIRATLRAIKESHGGRLLVAFQPHRFTRTRALLSQFAASFDLADHLWLADTYAASEDELPGGTSPDLAAALMAAGRQCCHVGGVQALPEAVRSKVQNGDVVLFLGAGDITKAAHQFAGLLKKDQSVMNDSFHQALRDALTGESVIRRDEPLAKRTTLRVGGPADFLIEPAGEVDLCVLLKLCADHGMTWRVIGRGSNLLVRDGGYRGVIISLAHPQFTKIELLAGHRLRCGAGARLKDVAYAARNHGIGGLEFLEGIPGNVGGALRMNAGAMGASTFETVESVWFMSTGGEVIARDVAGIAHQYRSCPMFKEHIALGAVFQGSPASPESIRERMEACSHKRWSSQPKHPSAGCMFKNPSAIPAGRLIDELGLKGLSVGGATVSDVHGNFLVSNGEATARDVLDLMELVKRRVMELRGIDLHTEVEIIGEDLKIH